MSVHEEQGSIELGVMVNGETGERRVSIILPDGTVILLTAEQGHELINGLTQSVADIEAQPYEAVGTTQ